MRFLKGKLVTQKKTWKINFPWRLGELKNDSSKMCHKRVLNSDSCAPGQSLEKNPFLKCVGTFQKGLPLVMRANIHIFCCSAVCVVFFYKNFRIFDASDPGAPSLPSVAQPLHLPRALRLLAQVGFSNGHDDSDLMWECGSVGWFEVPSLIADLPPVFF